MEGRKEGRKGGRQGEGQRGREGRKGREGRSKEGKRRKGGWEGMKDPWSLEWIAHNWHNYSNQGVMVW
jgi:hypothetical protein